MDIIRVKKISPAWRCCAYKWCVTVETEIGEYKYVNETLRKWFGDVEYFWNGTWLCGRK